VFYGAAAHIHHVGLYIGGGMMIDAPDFGQVVKIQPYRYKGDDYAGATRPSK
jgi:cell wall-associated NlpC family hydrolase